MPGNYFFGGIKKIHSLQGEIHFDRLPVNLVDGLLLGEGFFFEGAGLEFAIGEGDD